MKGRPFLRPFLVWGGLVAPMMLVEGIGALLLAPFLGGHRIFWTVAPGTIRFWAWAFGLRRILSGWEGLPPEIREGRQPALFVANHASLFDPPLLISTLPARPVFVAKRELAFVPVLGWVIQMAGFILIDRMKGARALASLRRAAKKIHGGQSIVAFPEGTRSPDGHMLPFKNGSFRLALEAQVPVIPLGILGGHALLPKGTWRVRPHDYEVRVGRPLQPADFPGLESFREAMEAEVRRLASEA